MDKDEMQRALEKQIATMEELKPITLRKTLCDWAADCLLTNKKLNIKTLQEWGNLPDRTEVEKVIIYELLDDLRAKQLI